MTTDIHQQFRGLGDLSQSVSLSPRSVPVRNQKRLMPKTERLCHTRKPSQILRCTERGRPAVTTNTPAFRYLLNKPNVKSQAPQSHRPAHLLPNHSSIVWMICQRCAY